MRIVAGGFGGMIGQELGHHLEADGHEISRLVRPDSEHRNENDIPWDPAEGQLDPAALEGVDAVIHLGGVNIADRSWTPTFKKNIRDSRIFGTRLLAETMAAMEEPPNAFLCASAIGFYGDRGDALLTETDRAATDFLAKLVTDWEQATYPAKKAGIRVVNLRIGVVLSPDGGALAKMLTPFKLGIGGRIGHGRQYMSWISQEDVVRAIAYCLLNDRLEGPVNLTAPEPVTNREFSKVLASTLRRPAILPVPAFMIRTLLGEMGNALILASTRVSSKKLTGAGFEFKHPHLADALRATLT